LKKKHPALSPPPDPHPTPIENPGNATALNYSRAATIIWYYSLLFSEMNFLFEVVIPSFFELNLLSVA